MDRHDNLSKDQDLLADKGTYKPISGDPTTRLKNKLIPTLRNIKRHGGLNDYNYRRLYPTSAVPPKFYGLPKIHNVAPLRLILSSWGSSNLWDDQRAGQHHLTLSRPVTHHIKNTQQFIDHIKLVQLQPGNGMDFYAVKALFTLVPVELATAIVHNRQQQDPLLPNRTSMSNSQSTTLLEVCLKTPTSSSRVSILNRSMV